MNRVAFFKIPLCAGAARILLSSILLFATLPSWAVDPLAIYLPIAPLVPERGLLRATQINRFDRDSGYHFGLGISWNPDLFSEQHHRLSAEVGGTLYAGSDQGSTQVSNQGLSTVHLSLLYEYRFTETFSAELGPGFSLWHSFGDNFSKTAPTRRDFKGGRLTFRFVDRFQPAFGEIFDRLILGFFTESASSGGICTALELGIGLKF